MVSKIASHAPKITIRAYEHDDKEKLVALLSTVFPNDPPWNDPRAMIDQKISHSAKNLLVGVDEDGMVIASVMAGYDGHRGWINSLCVSESHRGVGLGKMMVDTALTLLDELGAVKVNLQIRGGDSRLQQYYERLGFAKEDRISMSIMTPKGKSFL